MNREDWLHALAGRLGDDFTAAGKVIPAKLSISVGFPSRGATSARQHRIGECWNGDASKDGTVHIFISPVIADSARAGDVLVHELCHAVLPKGTKHNRTFAALARTMGLEGKPTATTASASLLCRLNGYINDIGVYPHSGLIVARPEKPQGTRLLKVACDCGYTVRITRQWLDAGIPICPICDVEMGEC